MLKDFSNPSIIFNLNSTKFKEGSENYTYEVKLAFIFILKSKIIEK